MDPDTHGSPAIRPQHLSTQGSPVLSTPSPWLGMNYCPKISGEPSEMPGCRRLPAPRREAGDWHRFSQGNPNRLFLDYWLLTNL